MVSITEIIYVAEICIHIITDFLSGTDTGQMP